MMRIPIAVSLVAMLSAVASDVAAVPSSEMYVEAQTHFAPTVVGTATVALPTRSDGMVEMVDSPSKLGIRFRLLGAQHRSIVRGATDLQTDGPFDSEYRLALTETGVKDALTFSRPPPMAKVSYLVDVSRVAGLRLVDGVVEYLDRSGTPRLRTTRPRVVDAERRVRMSDVSLIDCQYDVSTRPPWGRPVVAPSVSTCRLVVSWDPKGLKYPMVLDPDWMSTNAMSNQRVWHQTTLLKHGLSAGRVVATGGQDKDGLPLSTVEFFDPGTEVWAAAGSLTTARAYHTATELNDGTLLVVGGTDANGIALTSVERIFQDGSKPKTEPSLPGQGRAKHTANHLAGDDTLYVIGGGGTAPLVFKPDPVSSTWTSLCANCMLAPSRFGHRAVEDFGRIYILGGTTDQDGASPTLQTLSYDVPNDTWNIEPNAPHAHASHTATQLSGYRVLVVSKLFADIFHYKEHRWTSAATPPISRRYHTATLLRSPEAVLFTGGYATPDTLKSSSLYLVSSDPESPGSWVQQRSLIHERLGHTTEVLADGERFITTGGQAVDTRATNLVEKLSIRGVGKECEDDTQCQQRACVDNFCCEQECSGTCETCSVAEGAVANGKCGPKPNGTPCTVTTTGTGVGTCRSSICVVNDAGAADAGSPEDGGPVAGLPKIAPTSRARPSPFACSTGERGAPGLPIVLLALGVLIVIRRATKAQ